jgi:hypothetical protein
MPKDEVIPTFDRRSVSSYFGPRLRNPFTGRPFAGKERVGAVLGKPASGSFSVVTRVAVPASALTGNAATRISGAHSPLVFGAHREALFAELKRAGFTEPEVSSRIDFGGRAARESRRVVVPRRGRAKKSFD